MSDESDYESEPEFQHIEIDPIPPEPLDDDDYEGGNDEIDPIPEKVEDEDEDDDPIEPTSQFIEYDTDRVGVKNDGSRNEILVVNPENRMTSDLMSVFEVTEYISIRATQIDHNPYTSLSPDEMKGCAISRDIAWRELAYRKPLLTLRRTVGRKKIDGAWWTICEDWDPAEMIFALDYRD